MTDAEWNELDSLLEDFGDKSANLDWAFKNGNPDSERRASQDKSEAREKIIKFCDKLKGA